MRQLVLKSHCCHISEFCRWASIYCSYKRWLYHQFTLQ